MIIPYDSDIAAMGLLKTGGDTGTVRLLRDLLRMDCDTMAAGEPPVMPEWRKWQTHGT